MLLALLLLLAPADWVPARWHSADPKSLELLDGTPVNCLLLEPDIAAPAFLEKARARNIVTLALLQPGPHLRAQAAQAAALRMDGLVLEGDCDRAAAGSKLLTIELPRRRGLHLDSKVPIVGTSDGLWPGIQIEHGGTIVASPTSAPWIDTNGGFLHFLRAATDAAIWVGVTPPPGSVYPAERYIQAVSDAAIEGARWIVALDADLERRLLARQPAALAAWKRIARYLRYFEEHPEWRAFRPYSQLAVIQDAASGALFSGSLLDMLAFQHTSARVIPPARLTAEALHGVRVVIDVAGDQQALHSFTGTLVKSPSGWRFPPSDALTLNRRQLSQLDDLWEPVYHATARKNFGARIFNVSSTLTSVLASPDGEPLLVHLLNCTQFPGEAITVHVLGEWKRARLYSPEGPARELAVYPVQDGTGVDIDRIATLATLELTR